MREIDAFLTNSGGTGLELVEVLEDAWQFNEKLPTCQINGT